MKDISGLFNRMNKRPENNLVDYYINLYGNKIRPVDQDWIEAQRGKYENCPGYMQSLATSSKRVFNSYAPGKGFDSKRTFVLWKLNSICECLSKYGYGCQYKDCERCPVHYNANTQLEEIDMEIDNPTGGKFIKPESQTDDRIVFYHKGKKIEVYISNEENKEDENE